MRSAVVILVCLTLGACGQPVPTPVPSQHRDVGDESTLVMAPGEEADILAVESINLLDSEWRTLPLEYTLPPDARVKVLRVHERGAQVEVLDGEAKGKRGWVRWRNLR